MTQFVRPDSYQKALLGFDRADRIFGSTDVVECLVEAKEQQENRLTLKKIVTRYNLQGTEDDLTKAMHIAAKRFWTWHVTKCKEAKGYGANKKKIIALEAHLSKAAREPLNNPSDHGRLGS